LTLIGDGGSAENALHLAYPLVVSRGGTMPVLHGHRTEIRLGGASIASAAASCSHIFVADTKTLAREDVTREGLR